MRIGTDLRALNAWRSLNGASRDSSRSLTRLSSGQRINAAADDASGMTVSERMRAQTRGLSAALRNIQDGISYVQTADGALGTIAQLLQRGRELAVEAANTGAMTSQDREAIQSELDEVVAQIDHVTDTTEFNGKKILGGNDARVAQLVEGLRRSWLSNAESLIQTQYGLSADDVSFKIVAKTGPYTGAELAHVQGSVDPVTGKWSNLELYVTLSAFSNFNLPNGNGPPFHVDRVIAHEMTHAIMARTMNYSSLPIWFREGAAEFTGGADERLAGDLAANGGAAGVVDEIAAWDQTSVDYSSGYAAVKYLDSKAAGGIKTVMQNLAAGQSFDLSIQNATAGAYADAASFIADYRSAAGGQAFISGLNLADADVGAIGGGDAQTVIPDSNTDTWDPLAHFVESWPGQSAANPAGSSAPAALQIGANAGTGQSLTLMQLQVSSYDLGVGALDLVNNADEAITRLNTAINTLGSLRGEVGAAQNRLEHAYSVNASTRERLTASESRIRDTDMAAEMLSLTKHQLLVQSSTAMLAQAHSLHRDSLQVLLS